MNFNGGRLGFWFRSPDRSVARGTNVLLVWDPAENGGSYDNDVSPIDISANISARLNDLGYDPITVASYSAIPADLSTYAQVWDVGYNTTLSAGAITKFTSYLQSGGSLFLLGENAYFEVRDNSIADFVSNIGGGITSQDPNAPIETITATVAAEFRLSNQTSSVTLSAPGRFDNYGRGTVMTIGGAYPETVVWKTGSLTSAPAGAIAACLDVNVFVNPTKDDDFIDNLIFSLSKK